MSDTPGHSSPRSVIGGEVGPGKPVPRDEGHRTIVVARATGSPRRGYGQRVPNPFRQQIDASIVDTAAALIARRGIAKTSVQDVADAVGLSKSGLLRHFPSKDALHEAVLAHAETLALRVLDAVHHLPPGPERDRRAVDLVVDIALAHPGVVALLIAPAGDGLTDPPPCPEHGPTEDAVLRAFDVVAGETEIGRTIRVLHALSGLAVLAIAAHRQDQVLEWRPHLVATCLDALGHGRPAVPAPTRPTLEA